LQAIQIEIANFFEGDKWTLPKGFLIVSR
jgi:hypothetical protein